MVEQRYSQFVNCLCLCYLQFIGPCHIASSILKGKALIAQHPYQDLFAPWKGACFAMLETHFILMRKVKFMFAKTQFSEAEICTHLEQALRKICASPTRVFDPYPKFDDSLPTSVNLVTSGAVMLSFCVPPRFHAQLFGTYLQHLCLRNCLRTTLLADHESQVLLAEVPLALATHWRAGISNRMKLPPYTLLGFFVGYL